MLNTYFYWTFCYDVTIIIIIVMTKIRVYYNFLCNAYRHQKKMQYLWTQSKTMLTCIKVQKRKYLMNIFWVRRQQFSASILNMQFLLHATIEYFHKYFPTTKPILVGKDGDFNAEQILIRGMQFDNIKMHLKSNKYYYIL